MKFEFDKNKSRTNKAKHDINFVEVQALWKDNERIEIPARTSDEPRFVLIGKIRAKVWAVVITYRGENIRIISARRARKSEVKLYESSRF